MAYSRRRYNSSGYADINWKEWHNQKRAQLSARYGGIDEDVKQAFLNLQPRTLEDFFRSYERNHGGGAATYARRTYNAWRHNRVQPAAQTLERLLELLPSFLPLETKYELLRKLRERYRAPEHYDVTVTIWDWQAQLVPIIQHVIHKAYTAQLPANVESRLTWLSGGQMLAAKRLMAEAEAQASRIAVSHLNAEVQNIHRVLESLSSKAKTASHSITLPYGTIRMTIDRRAKMEEPTRPNSTPPPQSQSTALERPKPGALLQNAIQNLDPEQVKRISVKAVDEGLALEVEKARANQRYENASRDMDEFVHQAQRLDQQRTSDYQMNGEFKTASGTTSVRVSKEGSKITMVVAVVIGLILLLLFMSSRH